MGVARGAGDVAETALAHELIGRDVAFPGEEDLPVEPGGVGVLLEGEAHGVDLDLLRDIGRYQARVVAALALVLPPVVGRAVGHVKGLLEVAPLALGAGGEVEHELVEAPDVVLDLQVALDAPRGDGRHEGRPLVDDIHRVEAAPHEEEAHPGRPEGDGRGQQKRSDREPPAPAELLVYPGVVLCD